MTTMEGGGGRIWLRRVPLAVMAGTALLGAVLLRDTLTLEALATHREALVAFRDAHYVATLVLFLAAYVAIVAFSVPGATVATLAGGFLFGLWPGVLWNVAAATAGACLLFLVVRAGLGMHLAARLDAAEGWIGRIKAGLDRNQWSMLFLLRLLPIVPFFAANLIPALLGVGFWRFAVTTFLGIMPAALVFTAVGAGLGEVLEAGEVPDLGVMLTPGVLAPVLGLCLLAALPMAVRWWRGRPG